MVKFSKFIKEKGVEILKNIIFILLFFILLTACKNTQVYNHNYKYVGEGDYWQAEFQVKGKDVFYEDNGITKYAGESVYESTLTYKGSIEELQSIKKFKYSVEYPGGSYRENRSGPLNDGTFTFSGSGIRARENDKIYVVVNWDDLEESFELKVQE